MDDNPHSLNSLHEQLLFELLKAIDKIKENGVPQNFSGIDLVQIELNEVLNNLVDITNSIAERLNNIESEMASTQEILNGLKRNVDMLHYGLKVLYSDCATRREF
ncbi:MAG: hypothetical protein F7B60_06965 [Desulfurococcales archaeon]|nr:hypothetical protein [Desulfurococcales archaeon]